MMLKLSWAMVILSGFWRAMTNLGGQMEGSKQHFGPSLGLGPVKVSGSYSSASWGIVGGS